MRMRDGYDFYKARELNLVLDYFERKARGDFSVPVPGVSVFDHVVGSADASLALATFAERELRALYLGVGRPVTQAQAAELMEAWDCGAASTTAQEIDELEDLVDDLERQLERAQNELDDLRGDKEAALVRSAQYLPADLMPVIEQLQREGA